MDLSGRPLRGTASDRDLFVDRSNELRAILRSVGARSNVLVLGERGTGKTSLLRVAAADLETQGIPAVFLEGLLLRDAADVIELLRYRVAPRRRSDLTERRLTAMPRSALLLELVRDLEDTLDRPSAPDVVIVDEVGSADAAHVLFGQLRDELWRLPLTWIVGASASDRWTYLRPPADAFFPTVINLPQLADADSLKLLRKRVPRGSASDGDLRAVVEAADGNPRRLVALAADVVGGRAVLDALASADRLDQIVASLGETAQRVFDEIRASGPASASDEVFLERLGMKRSRVAQVLSELERAGALVGSSERAEGRRPRKVYAVVD